MRLPSPNLIRYVRPQRLQLWCAKKGILTGRWTQAQVDEIKTKAALDAEELRKYWRYEE